MCSGPWHSQNAARNSDIKTDLCGYDRASLTAVPEAMGTMANNGNPQPLNQSTCLALLRSVEMGRIAFTHAGKPMIFPINFVVDHGTVVFRAAGNSTLEQAVLNSCVAFEADGFTSSDLANDDIAWSVIITGTAQALPTVSENLVNATMPLNCWHDSYQQSFIRIEAEKISGRRFQIQRPSNVGVSVVRSAPITGLPE